MRISRGREEELYGTRDLTYSRWHRVKSIRRFMQEEHAQQLTYIDVDALEYCRQCLQPILLLETARDVGQSSKPTAALRALARRANLPAFLVFYRVDVTGEIESFRVRMVHPARGAEKTMTPRQYAAWLWSFREAHRCELAADGRKGD